MKDVTINSDIDHLYNNGLITNRCKTILKTLKVSDVYDIMTTTFPEQGTVIKKGNPLFSQNKMIYSKGVKKEIDILVDDLYKL